MGRMKLETPHFVLFFWGVSIGRLSKVHEAMVSLLQAGDDMKAVKAALTSLGLWLPDCEHTPGGRLSISALRNLLTNVCCVVVLDREDSDLQFVGSVRCTCPKFAGYGQCPHLSSPLIRALRRSCFLKSCEQDCWCGIPICWHPISRTL